MITSAAQPVSDGKAPSRPIVVQNYYYALPGKSDEVYALRVHASDVRVALGLPRGRVLRRMHEAVDTDPSPPLPDVIWECEYPNVAAREADVTTLGRSEEFRRVEKRMDSLLRNFQRVMLGVSGK
jgi:hypothetical protein